MRLHRPRFTVRWMMLAVVAAALASWWLLARPAQLRRLVAHHRAEMIRNTAWWKEFNRDKTAYWLLCSRTPLGDWHALMVQRYHRAADRPWLPLGPAPAKPLPGQILLLKDLEPGTEAHFGTPRSSLGRLELPIGPPPAGYQLGDAAPEGPDWGARPQSPFDPKAIGGWP